jgi:glutathione S-transferase
MNQPAPAHPIRLHSFALSGHGHRVALMLSLLGLPFETVEVDLRQRQQKTAAFLAINPFGQVPAIEDGDVALGDSNAILVYLATRYDGSGRWLPRDALAAAQVQRWFSLAAGELHDGPAVARAGVLFRHQASAPERIAASLQLFGQIEAHLAGRQWLVGDGPTLADVAMYTYTALAPEGGISLDGFRLLRDWLARVEALPRFLPMRRTPAAAA